MIVNVSSLFINGHLNSEFFVDIPYLTQTEKILLRDFIIDVSHARPLKGKNKTSWQNNQGREIPNTALYKQGNCWHYHCGPYQQDTPKCYTVNLDWNVDGLTSSAVLHYQKISEQEIFILAYSRQHIPFPYEAILNNPLIGRVQ